MNPIIWFVGGEDIRFRIPLLLMLRKMGFSVAAVGSEDSQPFDQAGINYYKYDLDREISPLSDKKSVRQLVSLFVEHKPDVVHAFDTKPCIFVPKAAKQAGIKGCVRTVTGMGFIFSSSSLLAILLRPVYRYLQTTASSLSDMTIFQNEDDKKYFESKNMVNKNKSFLVRGSGVDLDLLDRQKITNDEKLRLSEELALKDSLVITMVARLVRQKGVMEYLESARKVREVIPDIRFLLIGPQAGEGSQAIPREIIETYKDCVTWLGQRSDVPAILSISDIFVLPSYREGLSRVLLEAGSIGLPLISTNVPGCRDIVIDEVTGLLVPVRDSESLSKAIIRLYESQKERQQLGDAAKERISQLFSLDKVANSYSEIYKKLV